MNRNTGDIDPDHRHIPALDGIRGLAVMMVMVFHYFLSNEMGNFRWGKILNAGSHLGQTGVDLFFVLSGFLITGILLHAKQFSGFYRNFYARRSLRIFPLAFGALFFFYVIEPSLHISPWIGWKDQLWYWTYLNNIGQTFSATVPQGPGHFWSLAVEEHFYLIWPTVVLLCSRRGLYIACLICVVMALASRVVLLHLGYSVFTFTLTRLDPLAIGASLALFVRGRRGFAAITKLKPRLCLGILFVLLIPCWVIASGKGADVGQIFKYFFVAVFYGALLAAALDPANPKISLFFSNRVLRTFGKYSYGLYVWDNIIPLMFSSWISYKALLPHLHGPWLSLITSMVIRFSISCAAAFASWHLYEKQWLKLKGFFTYDHSGGEAARRNVHISGTDFGGKPVHPIAMPLELPEENA